MFLMSDEHRRPVKQPPVYTDSFPAWLLEFHFSYLILLLNAVVSVFEAVPGRQGSRSVLLFLTIASVKISRRVTRSHLLP